MADRNPEEANQSWRSVSPGCAKAFSSTLLTLSLRRRRTIILAHMFGGSGIDQSISARNDELQENRAAVSHHAKPMRKILLFAKQTAGGRWQKRLASRRDCLESIPYENQKAPGGPACGLGSRCRPRRLWKLILWRGRDYLGRRIICSGPASGANQDERAVHSTAGDKPLASRSLRPRHSLSFRQRPSIYNPARFAAREPASWFIGCTFSYQSLMPSGAGTRRYENPELRFYAADSFGGFCHAQPRPQRGTSPRATFSGSAIDHRSTTQQVSPVESRHRG